MMSNDLAGRQFARFCLCGALNTGLGLSVFALAIAAGAWYLAASAGAFAAGTLSGYMLNRAWTFRARRPTAAGLARYGCVQAAALGLNLAAAFLLVRVVGMPTLGAQAIALAGVSVAAFGANRRWTFRGAAATGQSLAGAASDTAGAGCSSRMKVAPG